MSAHTERDLTKCVAEAMDIQRLPHVYYCSKCGYGTKRETTVPAEEFHVVDPTCQVKHVVMYKIDCKKSDIAVNFDRPGNISTNAMGPCYLGCPLEERGSCSTCIHGSEKIVRIDAEKQLQGKTKMMYIRGCRIYRTLYKCNHPARSVETDAGTYMCAYVRCPNYKPK